MLCTIHCCHETSEIKLAIGILTVHRWKIIQWFFVTGHLFLEDTFDYVAEFNPCLSGVEIRVAAVVGECGIGALPSVCLSAAAFQWGIYSTKPGTQEHVHVFLNPLYYLLAPLPPPKGCIHHSFVLPPLLL